MNLLLLANLTENLEEARKPVSLHSGVTKDILLGNLNCVFGFCNFYLNKTASVAPTLSFKVNNKDSFTKDNSQDFPPVIINHQLLIKSISRRGTCRVKGCKIVLNITESYFSL